MSETKLRRYGAWAGNPKGQLENTARCIECLHDKWHPGGYQCTKPRGHGPDGLYCKVHDPAAVAERRKAADKRYKQQTDRLMLPYRQASAMRAALQAIAAGHNDPRTLADETLKEWFKT